MRYRATVTITYEKVTTSPELMYNSKNRKFRETVTLADRTTFVYTKSLHDTCNVTDLMQICLAKSVAKDIVHINDDSLGITFNGDFFFALVPSRLINGYALNNYTLN